MTVLSLNSFAQTITITDPAYLNKDLRVLDSDGNQIAGGITVDWVDLPFDAGSPKSIFIQAKLDGVLIPNSGNNFGVSTASGSTLINFNFPTAGSLSGSEIVTIEAAYYFGGTVNAPVQDALIVPYFILTPPKFANENLFGTTDFSIKYFTFRSNPIFIEARNASVAVGGQTVGAGSTTVTKTETTVSWVNLNDFDGAGQVEVVGETLTWQSNQFGGSTLSSEAVTFEVTDGDVFTRTWTGVTDTDWSKDTNWMDDFPEPDASTAVTIPSGLTNYPTATSAIDARSIDMASGSSLIANGTVTLADNIFIYNLAIPDDKWHLASSPVVGEMYDTDWISNNNISSGTTDTANRGISTYNNATDSKGSWVYVKDTGSGVSQTAFASGAGYSMKKDGATAGTFTFSGTAYPDASTNPISPTITGNNLGTANENRWNMVGNPFPSNLDIATFLSVNATPLYDPNQNVYVWDATNNTYTSLATGSIVPGQAFFVSSNVVSTAISFTEAMQTNVAGTFYKNTATTLSLSITDGVSNSSTKISYASDKTTGLDPMFDVGRFTGSSNTGTTTLQIFTKLLNGDYSEIPFEKQALPDYDLDAMIIPVGLTAPANKEFTFTVNTQNFPTDIRIYLEDREKNTFTRLDEANSELTIQTTDALNGEGRFYIHTSSKALSSGSESLLNSVSIYKSNENTLTIAGLNAIGSFSLYSVLGTKVLTRKIIAKNRNDIELTSLSKGIYIVQLQTEKGKLNRKIILE
ncbi:T9SS type A sorting domain-containing protein [uncultured Polaribacter sp.]|uniref:T9SS type A sorting domain-containing protein n=1 Tax=uncultured Polaribacter sp. TaxID=174711 RepID=UPI0026267301|nr:T9SS type A sorting domain-containing protein [uncultured Polaribacter sp.]